VLAPQAEQGLVTGVFAVFEDITERREDEVALRQMNQRLALALNSARTIAFEQDKSLWHTWIRNPHDASDAVQSRWGKWKKNWWHALKMQRCCAA